MEWLDVTGKVVDNVVVVVRVGIDDEAMKFAQENVS